MTLIARTKNHGAPTIIGDLLITSKDAAKSIILPSICRNITHLIPAGSSMPVGLAQKLFILNENLCIAFAGDLREIRDLLEDFRPFCKAKDLDAATLQHFVEAFDYSNFKESAFMMMLIENKRQGHINVFEISYGLPSLMDNELFDESQAIGSGTGDFESIINEKIKFLSSFEDGDPRQGIVKKESLIARFLAEERYQLRPLESQWGGGYELAYYNGKQLVKMDNIAYVLQAGRYDDRGEVGIENPMMVQYYKYEVENLFITTVEMHNISIKRENDFIMIGSRNLLVSKYLVPPIRRGMILNEYAGEVESFETSNVAMGFYIAWPDTDFFKPSFYTNSPDLTVSFSMEEEKMTIQIRKRAQVFINQNFREAYETFFKGSP